MILLLRLVPPIRSKAKLTLNTILFATITTTTPCTFSQDIQGSVLDSKTSEPIPSVVIKITQKSDTSVYSYITSGTSGQYETEAPQNTNTGINPQLAVNPVLINYVNNHIEIRIADMSLQKFSNAQLYGMDARIIAQIQKYQEAEYAVFRFNREVVNKEDIAFQVGKYGGVFTNNGFRFNTEVVLGKAGISAGQVKGGVLKGTGAFEQYIFYIEHEGYEPLEEEHAIDMENPNMITHYLQKIVQTYMFDISGELVPGGDTLLLLATGSQGTDTLYNAIANPDFALQFESLDETLDLRAIAENDSLELDSSFTKEAGEHYLTLEMKEKAEENVYYFSAGFYPFGSDVVAYIRNDPLDHTDNDTLFNAQSDQQSYGLLYYSSDLEETLVVQMKNKDYTSKTWTQTFTPGARSVGYDLRD